MTIDTVDWNDLVHLKELYDAKLDSLEKLLEIRVNELEDKENIRFNNFDKTTALITNHISDKVGTAKEALDARLESMNEFRGALKDQNERIERAMLAQSTTYLTLNEHNVWKVRIDEQMQELRDFKIDLQASLKAKADTKSLLIGYVLTGFSIILSIFGIVEAIMR